MALPRPSVEHWGCDEYLGMLLDLVEAAGCVHQKKHQVAAVDVIGLYSCLMGGQE